MTDDQRERARLVDLDELEAHLHRVNTDPSALVFSLLRELRAARAAVAVARKYETPGWLEMMDEALLAYDRATTGGGDDDAA